MAKLIKYDVRYYVIKVAGENGYAQLNKSTGAWTPKQGADVDYFVYGNGFYESASAAREAAERAAKKEPGNRYYVSKVFGGYMAYAPEMDSF